MRVKLLSMLLLMAGSLPVLGQTQKATPPVPPKPATAQVLAVSGTVVDSTSGEAIPGAAVLLKGTTRTAATDAKGAFRLVLPPNQKAYVLHVSSLGYKMQEIAVKPGQRVTVKLNVDATQLNEVQIVGYSVESKSSITGSTSTVAAPAAAAKVKVRGAPSLSKREARRADNIGYSAPPYYPAPTPATRESYAHTAENGFQLVSKEPLSTFSIDVDAASYSNVRRFLQQNAQLPPPDAVRTEELVNYFRYNYAQPTDASAPCALHVEQAVCPWAPQHQLVLVGVQGREVPTTKLPPANLVFLIDVSGSMSSPDKLPLVKASLRQLVQELRPQDRVSLVVYAGAAGLVLPPTPATERATILAALDRLEAGGSTAGGAGLKLAYATAQQYFDKEGNNRVILATDGDFNVGESSDDAMEHLITQERESGVFLSVLGFGQGNLQDSKMERLADKGNGNYAYIDNLAEGRRVLVQQFGGTLFTLAKDVKLQVEFNPAKVQAYRLIGYENRLLAAEDFNNDKKDAGDLGAGQQVTALYEVVPVGAPPVVDALKYQQTSAQATVSATRNEWLTVKMRYKAPQGFRSQLVSRPLGGEVRPLGETSENLRWAAAVAQWSLLLRQSMQPGEVTWDSTLRLARAARGKDEDGYRAECIRLMETAASLAPNSGSFGRR